jgi:hypothetical protein
MSSNEMYWMAGDQKGRLAELTSFKQKNLSGF